MINDNRIPYVTDVFLKEYKKMFEVEYSKLYINRDKEAIKSLFNSQEILMYSNQNFEYKSLRLLPNGKEDEDTWKIDYENALVLWNSLKITPAEALNEKLWVALENIYYLDYTLNQLNTVQNPKKIDARIIFKYNEKRSVAINSLALLWWSVYYTIDNKDEEDAYRLTKFFMKTAKRSTKMLWLSSNVISSKEVALGILEGIKELVDNKIIKGGRYAFTNANKLMNQIGGIILLDMLSRDEVKQLVIENLPIMEKTELV